LIFDKSDWPAAKLPRGRTPFLSVVIDTEEEFDWRKPFSREHTGVAHVRHLTQHNRLYERFGLKPTYVVDHPVAAAPEAYTPLRELAASGVCEVGAHLHPWVNPPFIEEVGLTNSFPGNLPAALEREKLRLLGEVIQKNIGLKPTVYRAGRFGIGPATAETLIDLGYQVDTSVVPRTDFRSMKGPDFTRWESGPRWFRDTRLLEVPVTADWIGPLSGVEPVLRGVFASGIGRQLKLGGVLARSRLLERIRLTPEGMSFSDLRRLVLAMYGAGHRVFNLIYHSPSVVAGNTPYVRSEAERTSFQATIERFLDFFLGELGGSAITLSELWQKMAEARLLAPTGAGVGRGSIE
jgi:hypothetical protein